MIIGKVPFYFMTPVSEADFSYTVTREETVRKDKIASAGKKRTACEGL